jgi:hypothetical protein
MPRKICKKGFFLNGFEACVVALTGQKKGVGLTCHPCKFFNSSPVFGLLDLSESQGGGKVSRIGTFWPIFLALPLFFQADVEMARDPMSVV